MSQSSDNDRPPQGAGGKPAAEADAAGMAPSVAGGVADAIGQPSRRDDDAGLASSGEAIGGGQAPQVGPDKERIDGARDPAGGRRPGG